MHECAAVFGRVYPRERLGMADPLIDHVDIRVSDVAASRAFYEAALAPLGVTVEPEEPDPAGGREIGFRRGDRVPFAIHSPAAAPGQDTVTTGAHIAFVAASTADVDAFHAAAVANGGTDIGPPGHRPEYSERYYGAFVLDPDGNNVEAVTRVDPEVFPTGT
jgi:catechol 2,3-dioxygenase-like lactoylglutathione lyase family enzyme